VFLPLPVALGIGWWLAAADRRIGAVKIPVPIFAIMFLVPCCSQSPPSAPAPR
jgi:hypothetical protein